MNLFAYRATKPKDLLDAEEPTGGEMNELSLARVDELSMVIAAWGSWVPFDRSKWFRDRVAGMAGVTLRCLGLCKNGEPFHPLYQPYARTPVIFELSRSQP